MGSVQLPKRRAKDARRKTSKSQNKERQQKTTKSEIQQEIVSAGAKDLQREVATVLENRGHIAAAPLRITRGSGTLWVGAAC